MAEVPPKQSINVEAIAAELHELWATGRQVAPLSERFSAFDLPTAYEIAEEIRRRRSLVGEKVVGRKIGFTNFKMWQVYNVKAPIWGYIYDTTTQDLDNLSSSVSLAHIPEPKIEPEIVFGLGATPEAGMDEQALLDCVEWVAPGFEIVQSIYPGWRFDAADAIAAFGLHAGLHIGPRAKAARNRSHWLDCLPNFGINLSCESKDLATGKGSDVLGGPLTALRHLNDLLMSGASGPRLASGEIITTGTLALAQAVRPGGKWRASPVGIELSEIALRFDE